MCTTERLSARRTNISCSDDANLLDHALTSSRHCTLIPVLGNCPNRLSGALLCPCREALQLGSPLDRAVTEKGVLQLLFDARFLGHALAAGQPPASEQAAPAPGPRGGAPGAAGAAQTARKKAFAGLEAALQVRQAAHAHAQQHTALSESLHKASQCRQRGDSVRSLARHPTHTMSQRVAHHMLRQPARRARSDVCRSAWTPSTGPPMSHTCGPMRQLCARAQQCCMAC